MRAFAGNGFDLGILEMRGQRGLAGSEVGVGIVAADADGLIGRSPGRQQALASNGIDGSQSGNTESDEEVTIFHIQFHFYFWSGRNRTDFLYIIHRGFDNHAGKFVLEAGEGY